MIAKILSLIGMPGSGKGTQARLLQKELNFALLDLGQALRSSSATTSIANTGQLAPAFVIRSAITKFLSTNKNKDGIIIDGAPRSAAQLQVLEECNCLPSIILILSVEENICIDRISKRYVDLMTGETYSARVREGLVSRVDDKDQTVIQRRIKNFKDNIGLIKESAPLYNCPIVTINGMQDTQSVFSSIKEQLNKAL